MIDCTTVKEIEDVLAMLAGDELPQVRGYLAGIAAGEYDEDLTALDLANELTVLDIPQRFPDFLIRFITELYLREIENGSDEAMNDLGAQYYDGSRGFEQSFEKAIYYYKMAAVRGNRQAQENLGYCYFYGRDGKPDYEMAFHCFALGAFDGHLISLYKIGDMYLHGLYVEKNEAEAFRIFLRCLDTMTPEAEGRVAGPVYLRVGRMLLEGRGTEPDPKGALGCFQKAEIYLYNMIAEGNDMCRKSLGDAIMGQARAREKLASQLGENTLPF